MDADCIERKRDSLSSRREKRWSMNSQRLEEIVAELMKPISDARRSFDMDLSTLLEEYLTEAGLHALEAGEEGSVMDAVAPNFAEVALLLQQSASIYGRKVDFLYQHVLSVSDSLHNSTQEIEPSCSDGGGGSGGGGEGAEGAAAAGRRRRARAPPARLEFEHIELTEWAGASRAPGPPPRPPPTLPRMYFELEPRVITAADVPLTDYAGETIGLISDFQVAWRLHEGMLVDELERPASNIYGALQSISLLELQAAIEAAAPPLSPASPAPPSPAHEPPPAAPSPGPPSPTPSTAPLHTSTPLRHSSPPAAVDSLLSAALSKNQRKRRNNVKIDDVMGGNLKIVIGKELRQKLSEIREFSIASEWITNVVETRKNHILSERRRLRTEEPNSLLDLDFADVDSAMGREASGFRGWSGAEAAAAIAALYGTPRPTEPDSEDDGFFERSSSLDGADTSRADEAAWRAGVLARAAASTARGALDVRRLGARLLHALPAPPAAQHVDALLRAEAADDEDVSRLFLTTLFLANAGNVEVIQGAPLSVNSFSLRLLSRDESLYCTAVAADDHLFH